MRIAILEDDDAQLAHLLHTLNTQLVLADETVSCTTFQQGKALQDALRRETFDLLVLDWNVPDLDGTDLLQWLRNFQGNQVPVLMLSSRASERDVAGALGLGADDYVVKPFRPLELCARIRRLAARRQPARVSDVLAFGDWTFDRLSQTVRFEEGSSGAVQFSLTDREFRLTLALFRNLGTVVSRAYLLESAGYGGEVVSSRTLDSHIYRLRNKLGLTMERRMQLQTVYGQGYRLEASGTATDAAANPRDNMPA